MTSLIQDITNGLVEKIQHNLEETMDSFPVYINNTLVNGFKKQILNEVFNETTKDGNNPLGHACENINTVNMKEIIKILLRCGINVNHENNYNKNPLMIACEKNDGSHNDIIKLLLEYKSNTSTTYYGRVYSTLLESCREEKKINFEMIKLLINNKADLNVTDSNGYTALHHFCHNCDDSNVDIDCFKLLMDTKNYFHVTALFKTISSSKNDNKYEMIKLLMKNNIDINYCQNYRNSKYRNDKYSMLELLCEKYTDSPNLETIKLLLDGGAHIYVREYEPYDTSALLCAILTSKKNSNYDLVDVLLNYTTHDINYKFKKNIRSCIDKILNNKEKSLLLNLLMDYCKNNKITLNIGSWSCC